MGPGRRGDVVVTYDHGRPAFVRLTADDGLEIHHADLTAQHGRPPSSPPRPSATVLSQSDAAPESSQSRHASAYASRGSSR